MPPRDWGDPPGDMREQFRAELIDAGVPELHLRHVLDVEPVNGPALEAARRFAADDSLFLLLIGGVGTRKTGAAVRAIVDFHASAFHHYVPGHGRHEPWFLTVDKLGKLGGFDKAAELSQVERSQFLVLDDLGAEYGDAKGWFASLFASLINARYERAAKTIITSNLSAEQIKAAYGERVADRIREFGTVFKIAGPSLRTRHEPSPAKARESELGDD